MGCPLHLQSWYSGFALADAFKLIVFLSPQNHTEIYLLKSLSVLPNALNFNQVRQAARVPEIGGCGEESWVSIYKTHTF